jgi:hypothetical protein
MAKFLEVNPINDENGNLIVIDQGILPEGVKRVFYIYGNDGEIRGGHRHKYSKHAMFCLNGSSEIFVHDGVEPKTYILDSPTQCLVLEPSDWREFKIFDKNAIILVISTELYDKDDYIYEKYN